VKSDSAENEQKHRQTWHARIGSPWTFRRVKTFRIIGIGEKPSIGPKKFESGAALEKAPKMLGYF